MGYLRWVLGVVALVLAALRGKGPLYRWLHALGTSIDGSLARARMNVEHARATARLTPCWTTSPRPGGRGDRRDRGREGRGRG